MTDEFRVPDGLIVDGDKISKFNNTKGVVIPAGNDTAVSSGGEKPDTADNGLERALFRFNTTTNEVEVVYDDNGSLKYKQVGGTTNRVAKAVKVSLVKNQTIVDVGLELETNFENYEFTYENAPQDRSNYTPCTDVGVPVVSGTTQYILMPEPAMDTGDILEIKVLSLGIVVANETGQDSQQISVILTKGQTIVNLLYDINAADPNYEVSYNGLNQESDDYKPCSVVGTILSTGTARYLLLPEAAFETGDELIVNVDFDVAKPRIKNQYFVDTIDDLRTFDPSISDVVQVLGRDIKGDKNGGPLRYYKTGDVAGTHVDNGISIIVPTGGNGSEAWLYVEDTSFDNSMSSIRQAILTGPDMIPVDETVQVAGTKSGDLRNMYQTDGPDMQSGSNGGFALLKSKGIKGTFLQSSVLGTGDFLYTDATDSVANSATLLRQFLETGVEIGSNVNLTSANLLTLQTTHRKVMPDGSVWHYNPDSGFAMWKYSAQNRVAFDLLHPMGHEPMFYTIKNKDDETVEWATGRYGTAEHMCLNTTAAEAPLASIWPAAATDTYIPIGDGSIVNYSTNEHFGWGFFGPALDDLHVGMRGMRGSSALLVIPANSGEVSVDTGIPDIQAIINKNYTETGNWVLRQKASGWDNHMYLNDTDAEVTSSWLTINGGVITIPNYAFDAFYVVIGGTATRPSIIGKTAASVVRKVGTAEAGHRVDLGGDAVSGDNGCMVFGRSVDEGFNNFLFDTINQQRRLVTNENYAIGALQYSIIEAFTTTGITLGSSTAMNSMNINQYTVFFTTKKITTSDGLVWSVNPLTGFGMTKYPADGVAGMTLTTPMGKKLLMGWSKDLDDTNNWVVYLHTLGATKYMLLNEANAASIGPGAWNDTEPTDTLITLGAGAGVNTNGHEYIHYGFYGDEQVEGASDGVSGMPGVSAFWSYTGGSGAMSVDTGLDDIDIILFKRSDISGDWFWHNVNGSESTTYYALSNTAVEGTGHGFGINGSIITYGGASGDVEFAAFSSSALGGSSDKVIIPATPDDPFVISCAKGFDSGGELNKNAALETSTALTITGDPGKKYIYLDEDAIPGYTDVRPEYKRNYIPYVNDSMVFDINGMKMWDATGQGDLIAVTWVPHSSSPDVVINGNIVTMAVNEYAICEGVLEIGKTYRVKCRAFGVSSTTIYLPHSNGQLEEVAGSGTYDYTFTAVSADLMIGTRSTNSGSVELYSLQEVLATASLKPLVFTGECSVDNDGNVFDIINYARGNYWESDWTSRLAGTYQTMDNPFMHSEIDVYGYTKRTTTGKIYPILFYQSDAGGLYGEFVNIQDDATMINVYSYLNKIASTDVWKVKLRRTF